MDRIYKLKGIVQHYSWGGTVFIPELLGIKYPEQKPFAEYWLGAHPRASATIDEKDSRIMKFCAADRKKLQFA